VSANQLLRRIPNDTGQPGDWQPDGSGFVAAQISYLSPNSPSGGLTGLERLADSHLLRYDAAGGERRDLTGEPGLEDAAPAFSPDGAQLAFARKSLSPRLWTPGRQLWVMRMADGSARPLTNDPLYTHFDFAWNPSGSQLAYVRFNQSVISEPPEVWIIDLNTGDSLRVIAGGYAPAWLP
jgi:Tol biopolymer transport system component